MTDKQPEALIRAEELEQIGAESSLARAMAAHTIRLLYKENEALRARLAQPEPEPVMLMDAPLLLNGQPLYTAPPQRERVQFPTMLRKMWSGTEVQAWLDENVNQENNNE